MNEKGLMEKIILATALVLAGCHAMAQSGSKAKLPHCSDDPRGKPPQYPDSLRGSGIHGTVILQAVVSEKGCTQSVVIVQKLDPALDELAKEMVNSWKFKPAAKDGKPVMVNVQIPVDFNDPGAPLR